MVKEGRICKDIDWYKSKPVNTYLAIDSSDEKFKARMLDSGGWLIVIFEWLDECGLPKRSISLPLGDFGDYVRSRAGEALIELPPWAKGLHENGKLSHEVL